MTDTVDLDAQEKVRAYVQRVVTSTMTARSERDMQRMPGPSDLADTCDRCVAECLGRADGIIPQPTSESFSLKAWVGTAIHEKLEREVPEHFPIAVPESTVLIHEIAGFGQIKGHIDLRLDGVWIDYKSTDLAKLRKYKANGVPEYHVGQIMLYGYGLRRAGLKAETACLVYIPRDSNRVEDVWVASCSYREDIALRLLRRAEDLLRRVRLEGVATIPSDGGCFVCTVQHKFFR